MAEELKIRNTETVLFELKKEVSEISSQVSSANTQKKEILEEVNKLRLYQKVEENSLESLRLDNTREREKIEAEKKHLEFIKQEHKGILENLQEKIKESNKEFKRVNSWLIQAREEEGAYKNKIEELKKEINTENEKVQKIFELDRQIKELMQTMDFHKFDYDNLIKEGLKESNHLKKELEGIILETENYKLRIEQLKEEKHLIEDEIVRSKEDLWIYTKRVEKVWKEVFPNRNMPMLRIHDLSQ